MQKIIIFNGSINPSGNTANLIKYAIQHLSGYDIEIINLSNEYSTDFYLNKIKSANGFIFASGTYWDNWGSPLQRFLEQVTAIESLHPWLGKPAAILVTESHCGGKGVMSRLQGVLSTLGLLIPPMSAIVYSLATHLAVKASKYHSSYHKEFIVDFYLLEHLEILCHNLKEAINHTNNWKAWAIDINDPKRIWLNTEKESIVKSETISSYIQL